MLATLLRHRTQACRARGCRAPRACERRATPSIFLLAHDPFRAVAVPVLRISELLHAEEIAAITDFAILGKAHRRVFFWRSRRSTMSGSCDRHSHLSVVPGDTSKERHPEGDFFPFGPLPARHAGLSRLRCRRRAAERPGMVRLKRAAAGDFGVFEDRRTSMPRIARESNAPAPSGPSTLAPVLFFFFFAASTSSYGSS